MAGAVNGPRIVFAGAGHAALIALSLLQKRPLSAPITVISSGAEAIYSGMVPGWIEGLYPDRSMAIPLAPLMARWGVDFVHGLIEGADDGSVHLTGGARVPFDHLVINTGARSALPAPLMGGHLLAARPISGLIDGLAPHLTNGKAFVIVGSGVAGIEVAFSLKARLPSASVSLVERQDAVLASFPERFRQRVLRRLGERGVELFSGVGVAQVDATAVHLTAGTTLESGCTLAFTGPAAPAWLSATPFKTTADGFVATDGHLRSLSHPNVLAVGDSATDTVDPRPKSGVFSVRQGPLLAEAVTALATGAPLKPVSLQKRALVLLSTGGRSAIAERNGLVLEGKMVWRLKDYLDRAFVTRFRTH